MDAVFKQRFSVVQAEEEEEEVLVNIESTMSLVYWKPLQQFKDKVCLLFLEVVFAFLLKPKCQTCKALLFYLSISHHVSRHTSRLVASNSTSCPASGSLNKLEVCESSGEHAWGVRPPP